MVDNRNTLNLKVGEQVEYQYNGKWYKATVVNVEKSNYQVGTVGYANGDSYIEPTIEFMLDNEIGIRTTVSNPKQLKRI